MSKASGLSVLFTALVIALSFWAWGPPETGVAAPILIRRGIIAGVAADSAPGPAPTPTPVPPPLRPVLSIRIEMETYELSVASGGTVVTTFRGEVGGTLVSGPPVSYLGGTIIEPHPTDVCTWETQYAVTALEAKASRQTSLFPPKQEVLIEFTGPEWHFKVTCPTNPPTVFRGPAFGERSLTGWLGLILPGRGPGPVAIETPVYSGGPSCLHNRGVESGSNQFGNVTIIVDIFTPPCNLPPAQ